MAKGATLDDALCDVVISGLDADVVLVGRGGRLIYANPRARERLGDPADGAEVTDIFADWDADMRDQMTRTAQANQWVPVNLTPRANGEAMRFRARGIRHGATGETMLLLLADRRRDQGFTRLKALVRELNQELSEKRRTQLALRGALDSEERLHSELIHRVKNNLSLLNALIHFRRNATNDPNVRESLKELEQRVHAILAVHDLLDRAGEIDYVRAGDLIRSLCHQLERSLLPDHIELENELLDISLNVEDATPLSLLINELVINAVKHAFPDGQRGTVHVALKKNGVDKLEVSVADNGGGYPDEVKRIGSGSKIVQALARQIGGTLERHTDQAGTHWSFIFPYRDRSRNDEIALN